MNIAAMVLLGALTPQIGWYGPLQQLAYHASPLINVVLWAGKHMLNKAGR